MFSVLVIVTKFADCYTTSMNIGDDPNRERNPIARIVMKRFGIQNSIRITFILTVSITVGSFYSVLAEDCMLYEILFIVTAMIVSTAQILAAMHNQTKKENILTRVILRIKK